MTLKRIVVIHDRLEARGGATSLARLSAVQYRKLGFDVVYISGSDDDQSLADFGIQTVCLGQTSLASGVRTSDILRGIHNRSAAAEISRWCHENDRPDTAYHLHNWAQVLSPSVFAALRPVADRTVVSCHDFFNVCPNGGLVNFQNQAPCHFKPMSAACWSSQCDRRSRAQKTWRMLRHLNLNRIAKFKDSAMTFVCLHAGMENVMREAGFAARHLTHIANPSEPFSETRIRAETNASVLFIGRLTEEKGADLLLEAAKQSGIAVSFAGEGPLLDQLSSRDSGAVFHGYCDRPLLTNLARSARALVVPGRWREPYGLVVAEAAQSGLPIIISQPSTLAGEVERLGFGITFDPTESTHLARILDQISRDDTLVRSMSLNAHRAGSTLSNTPHSWSKQFVDLMNEKINDAPR